MKFGEKLKELRIANGMTQLELSEASGFRQSCVSAWERGISKPLPEALIVFSRIFQCSIEELLCVEQNNAFISMVNDAKDEYLIEILELYKTATVSQKKKILKMLRG